MRTLKALRALTPRTLTPRTLTTPRTFGAPRSSGGLGRLGQQPNGPGRGVTAVVLLGLVAGLLPGAGMPARTGHNAPTPLPQERPVHGSTQKTLPKPADPAFAASKRAGSSHLSWPAAGSATVSPLTADLPLTQAKRPSGLGPATPAVRAGSLPVWVQAHPGSATPDSVRLSVLDRSIATRAGINGLLLTEQATGAAVSGSTAAAGKAPAAAQVSVSVDYSGFRDAYGGDWAQRLRLVQLPACAATTPSVPACQKQTTLPSTNDAKAQRVSALVPVASSNTVLAATADSSGSTGDYTATSLSPAGSWSVSTQSGDFDWTYQMRVPQVPGNLIPEVSADYSSGSVDGETVATNNQPSWVGDGWNLWPGFVERSYGSCADDTAAGTPKTGDECWITDNATLSLNGKSSELVKDAATGAWHLRDDNGAKVEHLTGATNGANGGEYWRVTTTDGTQYYFGLNHLDGWVSGDPETQSAWTAPVFGNNTGEPCHGATFASSWCQQAWRWNLDYVVDRHGDTITYYYQPETNSYGLNLGASTVSYTRGGTLLRAEYGTRRGQEYRAQAPARVLFDSADRCAPGADCTQHNATSYPDVPWDQSCSSACTTKYSPSFWSTKRLGSVTTQILNGSAYQNVDTWTFDQTYPDPGDGTAAALWLHGITHTGQVGGSIALPEETFDGAAFANRVNSASDGLPPMDKYRVTGVENESGGTISVNYDPTDCSASTLPTPDSNTQRCFPVYWSPPGAGALTDWFVKSRVAQVVQTDRVGGNPGEVTTYDYESGAAWAYNDNPVVPAARRSWSDWRGYQKVMVVQGDPADTANPRSATEYLYFRGMNGDHLSSGATRSATLADSQGGTWNDDAQFAGMTREQITYDGLGGPVVTDAINDPWQYGPTATAGTHTAYVAATGKTVTRTALSAGGYRTTEVDTSYDNQGNPTQVNDLGDVSTSADDRCTRTTYDRNENTWLLTLVSEVATVAVSCSATPNYPQDAISDVRTYYDDGAFGAAPTAGNATKVDQATSYSAGQPVYTAKESHSYDSYGRVLNYTDALSRVTKTVYNPASGLPTSTVVTNNLGYTTTTALDPDWNEPVSTVDANNRRTDLTYDALGRLTAVWKPGRNKAAGIGANVLYGYGVQNSAPNWVSTQTLEPNGNYVTAYTLYDGFLRQRQTQAPAEGTNGGRVLTDTIYDSRGQVAKNTGQYYDTAAAGTALLSVGDNQIYDLTASVYDGAGRVTASIVKRLGVEQWRTTTAYGGDHTDVTPPSGGIATTTYTDARGNKTELRQYLGGAPSGDYRATKYSYTPSGKLATVTDPAGNKWTYTYDLLGNQTASTDPDKGSSTATYDAAGEQLTATDGRGQTIAYVYDTLKRKVAEHQDSATGPLLASWTYDTLSKGDLTSSSSYDANGNAYTTTVTGYDAADRPTGNTVTIPSSEGALAGKYATSMTYRPDGSLSSVGEPALGNLPAETVNFGYDTLGKSTTTTGAATYVNATTYTYDGKPAQFAFGATGSRVWQSLYYDETTRALTESLTEREQGVTRVDDVTYGYNADGSVTSIADTTAGDTSTDRQCFAYDGLRELIQAWSTADSACPATAGADLGGPAPYWQTFSYDAVGNRTGQTQHGIGGAGDTTITETYPAARTTQPHSVQTIATTTPNGSTSTAAYTYDALGDTTGRPIPDGSNQALTWNANGDLGSVTTDGSAENYVYDAADKLLISKSRSGATLYLASGEVHADAAGNLSGSRYYQRDNAVIAVRTAAGVSFQINDRNATADLSVDAATLNPTKRRFDPFGGSRGAAVAWPDDRSFVGGIADATTGLLRLGARDYDPATGRFVSVDPQLDTSDPQAMNSYAYSDNDPVTFSDPTGKSIWGWVALAVTVAVVATAAVVMAPVVLPAISAWVATSAVGAITTAAAEGALAASGGGLMTSAIGAAVEGTAAACEIFCSSVAVRTAVGVGTAIAGDGVLGVGSGGGGRDRGNLVSQQPAPKAGGGPSPRFMGCLIQGPVPHSFTAGTKVLMADGSTKPIDKVKPGDAIRDSEPGGKGTVIHPVTRVITTRADHDYVDLTVAGPGASSKATASGTVTTTFHHPFYDLTKTAFVDAQDLAVGDALQTPNGAARITAVRLYHATTVTYDLTIGDLHTYYVETTAGTPVLVHNCGDSFTSAANLREHYEAHGKEVGAESEAEYAAAAEEMTCDCDPAEATHILRRYDSTTATGYYYDTKTGDFAIKSRKGIVTYFRPDRGKKYFDDQPGDVVPPGASMPTTQAPPAPPPPSNPSPCHPVRCE